eukprot:COSAG02_NODE_6566_length_3494_cov_11.517983_3_plen_474_part_00
MMCRGMLALSAPLLLAQKRSAEAQSIALAYAISGSERSRFNGRYERMAAAECNGKPVYQLGRGAGYVLFQPNGTTYWMVGASDRAMDCDTRGYIWSNSNGDSCAASPDGAGCAGLWRENVDSCDDTWCPTPSLAVSTCPAHNPCCGLPECGAYGLLIGDGTNRQCGCNCSDSYVGETCQFAPAYAISGSERSQFNGRYERMAAAECNGKPVYLQLGNGYVLFQPNRRSYWKVGSSDRAMDCIDSGFIWSNSNGPGSCAASPDGAGCAGLWRENVDSCDDTWCPTPSLAVSTCLAHNPCCGLECGAHGLLIGDGTNRQCGCNCSDSYVGETCQFAPAYAISGSERSQFNGRYERMAAAECNGKPVYLQLGNGYVLFQPNGTTYWVVGPSDRAMDCDTRGFIWSNSNGGSCAGHVHSHQYRRRSPPHQWWSRPCNPRCTHKSSLCPERLCLCILLPCRSQCQRCVQRGLHGRDHH